MAAERGAETLTVVCVDATSGLRHTVSLTDYSGGSLMDHIAETTKIPKSEQIVIVGGAFRQLSSSSDLAALADSVGDPEVFVFSKALVQQAKDVAEKALRLDAPGLVASAGDAEQVELDQWKLLVSAGHPPPGSIGDVSAVVFSDMDRDLGDAMATSSMLEPVAPWFATSTSDEVVQEHDAWVSTTALSSSQLLAVGSSSVSPLLATLPAYVRRLRRIHLAAAVYRQTAAARRRWAREAAERAVNSCQCANAASRNLSRLGLSLQDKTAQTVSALTSRLARWSKIAERAPTYMQRLARVPLVASIADAASAARGGVDCSTLASVVPADAIKGWAEQCKAGIRATTTELASLDDEARSFFSDSPFLTGAAPPPPPPPAGGSESQSALTGVSSAVPGIASDEVARRLLEAGSAASSSLEATSRASEAVAQGVMRAVREAARRAALTLQAGAGSGGVTASGSAGGTSIMEIVSKLEAAVSDALEVSMPQLVRADEEMVTMQSTVLNSLSEAQVLLGRRIGGVALKQEALVSLFARRRAVEEAGDVLVEQCGELEHLRSLPKAYAAAVAEAVRRNAFTEELNARLRAVADELGRLRAEEAEARDRFARRLGSHLPVGLIPGLDERPPHVQIACVPATSVLPVVTADDAEAAAEAVSSVGVAVALPPRSEPASGTVIDSPVSVASDVVGAGMSADTDGAESVASSGRGSPVQGLMPLLSAGSLPVPAGERRLGATIGSAARTLEAVAAADELMTVRVASLERENASLRAELLSLMAVVRVGGDESDEDDDGDDDEGDDHGDQSAAFELGRGVSGETGAYTPSPQLAGSLQASPETDLSAGVSSPLASPEDGSLAPSAASAAGGSAPARHHADAGQVGSIASSVGVSPATLSKDDSRTDLPPSAAAIAAARVSVDAVALGAAGDGQEPTTGILSESASGKQVVGSISTPVRAALSEGGEARGAGARGRATSDAPAVSGGPPQAVGPPASPVQRPVSGGVVMVRAPPPLPPLSSRAASDGASPRARNPASGSASSSAASARRALQRIYELATFKEAEFQRHRRSLAAMITNLTRLLEPRPDEVYGEIPPADASAVDGGASSEQEGFVSRAVSRSRGRDAGLQLLRDAASLAPHHGTAASPSPITGTSPDSAAGGFSAIAAGRVGKASSGVTAAAAAAGGGGAGDNSDSVPFPLPPAAVLSESAPTSPRGIASPNTTSRQSVLQPIRPSAAIPLPRLAHEHLSTGPDAARSGTTTTPPVVSPGDSGGSTTGPDGVFGRGNQASSPEQRSVQDDDDEAQYARSPYRNIAATGQSSSASASKRMTKSTTDASAGSRPTVLPADVTDRVKSMASALRVASALSQKLRDKCESLLERDRKRVSFLSFRVGDLALFTRARVSGVNSAQTLFVALHHNCPRLYLDQATVADSADESDEGALPDVMLVLIESLRRVSSGDAESAAEAAAAASSGSRVFGPGSLRAGDTFWEAAGQAMYTMTRGVVRTSPALGPAPIPSTLPEPSVLDT